MGHSHRSWRDGFGAPLWLSDNGEALDIGLSMCLESFLAHFTTYSWSSSLWLESRKQVTTINRVQSVGRWQQWPSEDAPLAPKLDSDLPLWLSNFPYAPSLCVVKGHKAMRLQRPKNVINYIWNTFSVSSGTLELPPQHPHSGLRVRRTFHTVQMPTLERKWSEPFADVGM